MVTTPVVAVATGLALPVFAELLSLQVTDFCAHPGGSPSLSVTWAFAAEAVTATGVVGCAVSAAVVVMLAGLLLRPVAVNENAPPVTFSVIFCTLTVGSLRKPKLKLGCVTFGVLVPATSELRTLDDLFAFARARPGELSIATNGIGTTPHVVLEELFNGRGLSYIHVPYKGTSELTLAVESGQVMAGINSTGFGPLVDSGRLRLLVTFAAQRSKRWPQIPTLRELGYDIVAMSPYGLAGPRGLPVPIVTVLHDAFRKALVDPQVGQELAKYDQEIDYLGPEDYGRACREQYALERVVAERLGLLRRSPGGAGG